MINLPRKSNCTITKTAVQHTLSHRPRKGSGYMLQIYPITPFQVTQLLNHGKHCLPLLSPNPTTYHPSNLTSTYFILSPYPPNLSPFSKFFLHRGIAIGSKAFPCHYILKNTEVICGALSETNYRSISTHNTVQNCPVKARHI